MPSGGRRIFHSDGRRHRSGPVANRLRRPPPVLPTVRLRPPVLRANVRAQGGTQLGRRLRPARVARRTQVFAGRPAGRRPQGRRHHIQPGVRDGAGFLDPGIRRTRVSCDNVIVGDWASDNDYILVKRRRENFSSRAVQDE